ncbi:hypothetical protein D3C80_1486170 [compost metagenome]
MTPPAPPAAENEVAFWSALANRRPPLPSFLLSAGVPAATPRFNWASASLDGSLAMSSRTEKPPLREARAPLRPNRSLIDTPDGT